MRDQQTRNNPDVNTFIIDEDGDETNDSGRNESIEDIPLPPDSEPSAPVEEPPGSAGTPIGEVDDSPKKIA
jgi:hypothetical protein